MFAQLFGNFLLSEGVVTLEQLVSAIEKEASAHIKIGTLAIHAGYMNAQQVEDVRIAQTHEDRKFGEISVDKGYLTPEQLQELLREQYPKYLMLGQILEEDGVITNEKFQELLDKYREQNEISAGEMETEVVDIIYRLLRKYYDKLDMDENSRLVEYVNLMFNNLIRFIGDDFTPFIPYNNQDYPTKHCAKQKLIGTIEFTAYIAMPEEVAIEFASRYVGEEFTEFDEYVQASMEDFLNLHNGLYTVNMSNNWNIELQLEPPVSYNESFIDGTPNTYVFPVIFPFGTVHMIIETPESL